MKTSIPWSIKGIEPEAREAAKVAARRSGMTLGQWLNSVILDTNDEDEPAGFDAYSDRVPHRNAGRHEAPRYGEDIQDRLDELTFQISNLTRRQSETAVSRVVEPKLDLEPVTEAVRELIGRVERNERRSIDTLETFDKRLQHLSDRLTSEFEQRDKQPDTPDDENFQAFELALKNIVDHIEQTDKRNTESISAINSRLGELSLATQSNAVVAGTEKAKEVSRLERQLAEMASRIERAEHRKTDTNALTAIESRVSDLSTAIESRVSDLSAELRRRDVERAESRETDASALTSIESRVTELSSDLHRRANDFDNFVSRDDLQLIQARIQDIVNRLDETNSGVTDATIASMQQEIALLSRSLADQKLDGASSAEVQGLKHTIDAVAAQMRDIAEFSVDPDVAVKRIEEEITSLSQSVADLSIESASNRELTELRDRFEQIAEEVQIQQNLIGQVDPNVIHQTRAELGTLNEMMTQVRNDAASIGDMQKLRETVTQMSAQISQIGQSAPDAAAHQALELRLSEFAQRLDQDSSNSVPRQEMGALDQRIRELEGQLQAQLEAANSAAADDSANTLLQKQISDLSERIQLAEAAALQPMPSSNEIPSAAVGAITALEQGLQSVQDNAHKADKRTQETLEAVHETLEKVVTRLARLEDAPSIAPPAYTSSMADAALPPVSGYSEAQIEHQSTSDDIDSLQLPPIIGLDDQPSGLSIGEPPMEAPAYAFDESEEALPDLRLDPVDLQQDFSEEHLQETPAESFEASPTETPQIQADDFIAAARRAAQSSPEADKAEEEPAPSRFNILRRRAKSESKKDDDAKSGKNKKKTVLLAAAIALLAIGTLSTMNLVTGKRALTPEPQMSEALTAPTPSAPATVEPNFAELSTALEKSRDAIAAPQASQIDRPVNPQSLSAGKSGASSNASQVYQRILEARKKRRVNGSIDREPVNNVPLAVPLGDTQSDQIVTGSIQSQRPASGQKPVSRNRAVDARDSLLTESRVASKPEKSDLDAVLSNASNKSSRGAGFISVSDSLPPAEIGPMSLRVAAATGNQNAQFEVAARYAEGKIITQDFRKAAVWYQKAAAKGLAPAQYRLGTLYEKGKGVPADKAAARIWYERAAEKGNSKAMHNLAVIYADTSSSEPNFAKAALWFRSAAELGLTDSQYNYGILNERGLGVRSNAAEAYKWFSIAAQNGDKDSKNRLPLLEKKLSPEVLIRAKLDAENWEPRDPVREANRVAAPADGWGSVNTRSTQSTNTRKSIANAQGMLNDMGYLAGPSDGVLGPRTRDAIRKFQRDSGLPATGMVTRQLLQKLIQQPG